MSFGRTGSFQWKKFHVLTFHIFVVDAHYPMHVHLHYILNYHHISFFMFVPTIYFINVRYIVQGMLNIYYLTIGVLEFYLKRGYR